MHGYHGNIAVLVRAYVYVFLHGGDGLRAADAGLDDEQVLGLGHFDLGQVAAMRKTDHGADQDIRVLQGLRGQLDVAGLHADRGGVIARGQLAPGQDVLLGQLGTQQRMVNDLCQLLVGNGLAG